MRDIYNSKPSDPMDQFKRIIFISLVALFIIITFFSTYYVIDSGERGVLLTFGKADPNSVTEGLHFKIPFVQNIVKMSIRTQKYEADASASSSDLQIVSAKMATNYHIIAEKAPDIYISMGTGFSDSVISPMEQEAVKSITAQFTAEELITKREEVREKIKALLKDRLAERNIIVEEVSIVNFDFSKSFNDAIEAKVTAEQQALQAKNKLEQIKFEAQQAAAQAEGQKNAKIAQAEGDAKAIEIINEQLKASPQYIDYYKIQKWTGVLPLVTGGSVPMINIGNITN